MANTSPASINGLEFAAFAYAVLKLEESGEMSAEDAVRALRSKMGFEKKALARKRGRKEMTFEGRK